MEIYAQTMQKQREDFAERQQQFQATHDQQQAQLAEMRKNAEAAEAQRKETEAENQREAARIAAEAEAKEAKCQASKECMTARIIDQVCDAMRWRDQYKREIAHERANPSGFVNASRLRETGEFQQQAEATIASGKEAYLAWNHKAWAVRCKAPPVDATP